MSRSVPDFLSRGKLTHYPAAALRCSSGGCESAERVAILLTSVMGLGGYFAGHAADKSLPTYRIVAP